MFSGCPSSVNDQSLAFAIDITTSMGEEIDEMKSGIFEIIKLVKEAGNSIKHYVIAAFADPGKT